MEISFWGEGLGVDVVAGVDVGGGVVVGSWWRESGWWSQWLCDEVGCVEAHCGLTADSLRTHCGLTADSLRTHYGLTADSLRIHLPQSRERNREKVAAAHPDDVLHPLVLHPPTAATSRRIRAFTAGA